MKKLILAVFTLFLTIELLAQSPKWNNLNLEAAKLSSSWSSIRNYSKNQIVLRDLRNYLVANAPEENTKGITTKIELPWYDGQIRTYYIMESTVMESDIAAKYSEIKTYKGTDGLNYMRMIVTPHWMKAYILTEHGDVIIESLDKSNPDYYGVYHSEDIMLDENLLSQTCGERGNSIFNSELKSNDAYANKNIASSILGGTPLPLITYRIAIACTGEFGQTPNLGGGSVASVIEKMADALTYANAVYERDFSIHFNMVNNNERIIFLDPQTDPYDNNGSGRQLLEQNSTIVNARITLAAFDVGHVFNEGCSDVGGVAFLGVVCSQGKASGVTCWYTPDVAYVSQRIFCHEMGHQFSASHTFSNCNGNESGTRYEPGSGNSIMSYNGLCGQLNIPNRAGDGAHPNFFHSCSVEQVLQFTRVAITCGVKTDIKNNTPTASIITSSKLVLPIFTPFELKGSGTDLEDTTLTYSWEQYDNGSYGDMLGEVTNNGPLFRTLFPSKNPNRVLPWWNGIFNPFQGMPNVVRDELLPSVARDLNFRFIVRDNHPGGGATDFKELKLKVTDKAGPFKVLFPNTNRDSLLKNACNKITWDVANTFNIPVNCKKVDIYMFKGTETDKLILLKANTDNDGVEIVDIPDIGTNVSVRVLIKAVDNIFFDVSDRAFRIIDARSTGVNMGVTPNVVNICLPQIAEVKVNTCSFGGYKGDLKLFIESGLPQGSTYKFEKSSLNESEETKLSIDVNNLTVRSTINIVVAAITPQGDTLRDNLVIYAIKNEFSDQALISPLNGAKAVIETPIFRWKKSVNSDVYTFEIATSPTFGSTMIYTQDNINADTFLLPVLLKESKVYYWRVIPANDCGLGISTLTYALQTVNKTCVIQSYTGNPVGLFANKTYSIKIPVSFNGNVSDINLTNVDIDADAVNNTRLHLVSPSGTRVTLFNAQCGVLLNFRCSFDDDAPVGITCPPLNFLRMRPFQPLSKFNGESLKGDWAFEAVTTSSFRDGLIKDFKLEYCAELKVSHPFNSLNLPLRLNVGETKSISNTLLLSEDTDNTASELTYIIVNPVSYGFMLLNGNPLSIGNTFTQKDIDENRLSYQHTGNSSEVDGFYFSVTDGQNGFYGVSLFTIYVGAVATKDLDQQNSFTIYPNPGNGLYYLLIKDIDIKNADVVISDISGKVLLIQKLQSLENNSLDLQTLNDGIYFVTMKTKNSSTTRKLILKK